MADFSTQATSLSGPQGQGSQVINPVTPVPAEASFLSSQLVSSVVDVFSKGLVQSRKEDAEKRKNTIIQGYIRQETTLNDAVASGQMTPSQAAARSRSNFNQYAAGYGEFIEDFEKAGKALRGFTEKGESEKKLEIESKRREGDVKQAQDRGFTFISGMSPIAEDAQIKAAKAGIQAEQALAEMYKSNAEKRAQGTFDQAIAAREEKDLGFRLVNEIAGSNLTAFQEFSKTLGDQVRAGKMSPEMAQATLSERFTNISGALQAAARTNPELAAPYRSLFDEVNKIGLKLIDPKSNLEDLQNQLNIKTTQMKMVAMQDPKLAATIVANQLLPNNPSLALSSAPEGVRAIAILSSIPVGDTTYTPRVVGNPDAEESTLTLLKAGLTSLKSGKVENKEIAALQASSSVNHILKQTGEIIDRGASPQQLKGVASFFASPEYAGFVTSGAIDPQAAGAAKKTFQILYEPAIIKGVQERMEQTLKRGHTIRGGASATGVTEPSRIGDVIDIKFTGSGVVFEMKQKSSLSPAERVSQQETLNSLKSAQQGVNQLIHIGAHMEGSTDYNKFWEDNKHVYLPNMFSKYKGLDIGTIKNGFRYQGGDANSVESWKKVE